MTQKLLENNKDSKLLKEMKNVGLDIEEEMTEEKEKREKKQKEKYDRIQKNIKRKKFIK